MRQLEAPFQAPARIDVLERDPFSVIQRMEILVDQQILWRDAERTREHLIGLWHAVGTSGLHASALDQSVNDRQLRLQQKAALGLLARRVVQPSLKQPGH